MRILPPFEEKIRHSIRDELAKKPTVTMTALKEQLEKEYGRDFHFSYIRRLLGKVRNEIVIEVDRAQIEPRLASLRENYRLMREELLKIVYWTPDNHLVGTPKPLARDRVTAFVERGALADMDKAEALARIRSGAETIAVAAARIGTTHAQRDFSLGSQEMPARKHAAIAERFGYRDGKRANKIYWYARQILKRTAFRR
jgi:hypothetical protein